MFLGFGSQGMWDPSSSARVKSAPPLGRDRHTHFTSPSTFEQFGVTSWQMMHLQSQPRKRIIVQEGTSTCPRSPLGLARVRKQSLGMDKGLNHGSGNGYRT